MEDEPDDTRKSLIEQLINDLKSAGIWDKLDLLYVMAAHHEQASRLTWKSPGDFTLSPQNSLPFTTDRGWQGDASSGASAKLHLTGWNPDTHAVNFQQDSACIFMYVNIADDNGAIGSGHGNVTGSSRCFTNSGTGIIGARVNDSTLVQFATATRTGLISGNRNGANNRQIYKDGSIVVDRTDVASTGFTNQELNVCGRGGFSSRDRVAAFGVGASLNATEQSDLNEALFDYLQPIGAN
jgi:hypothetical protein